MVAKANELKLSLSEPANFQSVPGQGVRGNVEGKSVAVGNSALMRAVGASRTRRPSQFSNTPVLL